eukprot:1061014-Alexandrium_andersonii.AAC.1
MCPLNRVAHNERLSANFLCCPSHPPVCPVQWPLLSRTKPPKTSGSPKFCRALQSSSMFASALQSSPGLACFI